MTNFKLDSFIKEARGVHGDKYDYTKSEYINRETKVCIICPKHGEFLKTPYRHLTKKEGCPKCSHEELSKRFSCKIDDFIKKSKKIHGNKYDYSKVNYINCKTKVTITCSEHGDFQQTPTDHLRGHGCQKCGQLKLSQCFTSENGEFLEKAKEIHGDKYNYSKVNYVNCKTKICIVCPFHGEFWQTPSHHLQGEGCPKCRYEKNRQNQIFTTEDFIRRCKKVHGDKYDYSKVIYKGYEKKVCIICHERYKNGKEHGEFWQSPDSHLHSTGCPKCGGRYSRAEDEIVEYLRNIDPSIEIETKNRTILPNSKEIDIYFPNLKIGIEYNGLVWHSDKFKKDKFYHLNKTINANNKGVKLIQIFEDEFLNKKDVVLITLTRLLCLNTNKEKINSNETVVGEITSGEARPFLDNNHIEGYKKATHHLGCFHKDELVGVMSFTKKRQKLKDYKLICFASNIKYDCGSLENKLFNFFIENYQPQRIETFADRRWTIDVNSNLFTNLGFALSKELKPDYSYFCPKHYGINRIHKSKVRNKENIYKIWDCGMFAYEWRK